MHKYSSRHGAGQVRKPALAGRAVPNRSTGTPSPARSTAPAQDKQGAFRNMNKGVPERARERDVQRPSATPLPPLPAVADLLKGALTGLPMPTATAPRQDANAMMEQMILAIHNDLTEARSARAAQADVIRSMGSTVMALGSKLEDAEHRLRMKDEQLAALREQMAALQAQLEVVQAADEGTHTLWWINERVSKLLESESAAAAQGGTAPNAAAAAQPEPASGAAARSAASAAVGDTSAYNVEVPVDAARRAQAQPPSAVAAPLPLATAAVAGAAKAPTVQPGNGWPARAPSTPPNSPARGAAAAVPRAHAEALVVAAAAIDVGDNAPAHAATVAAAADAAGRSGDAVDDAAADAEDGSGIDDPQLYVIEYDDDYMPIRKRIDRTTSK